MMPDGSAPPPQRPAIRVWFTDFWDGFSPTGNVLYLLLSRRYDVTLTRDDPDYLIYSFGGFDHLNHDCVRIFHVGENFRPDFNICDYALGLDYLEFGDRYIRFPSYALSVNALGSRPPLMMQDLEARTGFCNFLYSNAKADPARERFFTALSRYKRVDSPGRLLNNMEAVAGDRFAAGWQKRKIAFLSRYKFTIAFENSCSDGYTTEKLTHALMARTIPIYWGNPKVTRDFDSACLVNCHAFGSFDEVIEKVKAIDSDDASWLAMVNRSCFAAGAPTQAENESAITAFLDRIIQQPPAEARRRPRYGLTTAYEKKLRRMAFPERLKRRFWWGRRQ